MTAYPHHIVTRAWKLEDPLPALNPHIREGNFSPKNIFLESESVENLRQGHLTMF